MDIYAEEGTKVIVTEDSIKNGYDHVEEHARKFLKVGKTYTIESTDVSRWNTDVYLKEFPDEAFNSVSFEGTLNCSEEEKISKMKNKILKPFIQEGSMSQIVDKDDCLKAMNIYLDEFAKFFNNKMEEFAIHCGVSEDLLNEFKDKQVGEEYYDKLKQ